MIRLFINVPLTLNFWAAPHHVMENGYNWGAVRSHRRAVAKLKVVDADFPRLADPEFPRERPVPAVPTDVPAPEPHDIPVREPMDVPVPEPGTVPPETKPLKQPSPEPSPRSVP